MKPQQIRWPIVLFCLTAIIFASDSTQAQDRQNTRTQALPNFVQLAEKMGPIVVNISTTQRVRRGQSSDQPFEGNDQLNEFWRRFFGDQFATPQQPFSRQALGSGFIIDPKGLILTNNHVVENADKITVKLSDDREFEGKLVGRDPRTDMAVLQISDSSKSFPAAVLADSDRLEVGEWVLAVGSPFGLSNSVTAGIVSAKARHIGAGPYDDFIQTDASINPGNSGGPLINLRGEVVGINTAIFSRTGGNLGIGFAIPINLAKSILPELIQKGKVTRGWLGVTIQPITPEIAESLGLEKDRGALVADVAKDSPAAQSGIRVGDVIVEYNGKDIKTSSDLPLLVAQTPVGSTAKLTVLRDKKQVPMTVKIAQLKDAEVVATAPQKNQLGLAVQNITPEMAESLGADKPAGVVVTSVQPGSVAAEAGIRRGDVILEINRTTVGNTNDFQKLAAQAKPGENILFLMRRGGNNLFVALQVPAKTG